MATVTVRTPSLSRFRHLFCNSKDKSIFRCLEYERLSKLGLVGRVLDFGGGDKTNYSKEIANWGNLEKGYLYESANIDPKTEPTYLLNQEATIPVESEYYDAVISFNTLEHVYDLPATFDEIQRVLKSEGRLVFIVPFIFRVHGHPDDYMRGTPSFWHKISDTHGFEKIEIEAMNWGPLSTALTISGLPGPFKTLRRNLALLMDILYSARHHGQDVTLIEQQDAPICCSSLGYFVQALKRR